MCINILYNQRKGVLNACIDTSICGRFYKHVHTLLCSTIPSENISLRTCISVQAKVMPWVPECVLKSNSSWRGSSQNKLAAASSVITGKQESEKQSLSSAVIFIVKCLNSCSIRGLSGIKQRALEKVKGIMYWHWYSSLWLYGTKAGQMLLLASVLTFISIQ